MKKMKFVLSFVVALMVFATIFCFGVKPNQQVYAEEQMQEIQQSTGDVAKIYDETIDSWLIMQRLKRHLRQSLKT